MEFDAIGDAPFDALLQALPDAVLGVDSAGVIQRANARAEALFGYAQGALVGLSVDVLVPEAARNIHESHRARYAEHPHTRAMGAGLQLAARRKDGSEFPADISLSSVATGHGLLVFVAVRDVSEQWAWSERERLIGELDRSQRLDSLGKLAGGVAHDFNNLLSVILNSAAFVIDTLAQPMPQEPADIVGQRHALRSDVEEISRAAERAAELTRQLLIFGRADAPDPEVLDVNAVVADVDKLLRRTLAANVRLATHLGAGLWPVEIDRGRLEQVLVNLAVNARDAMTEGGTIDFTTANVHEEDRPWVEITVSDSGTGMPAAVAERAFEPFFTTKRRGEGSGLGLATVYGIVSQAGGTVHIDSEPGRGSTFRILLPAADAAASEAASEPAAPVRREHREQGVVLVAEDEPSVREIVRRVLVAGGYHPVVTRSGEEALAVLVDQSRPVDALLTDVVMPGMSGVELYHHAVAARPGLPVVYMSGYQGAWAEHTPDVPVVAKPFTAAGLLAAVDHVFEEV